MFKKYKKQIMAFILSFILISQVLIVNFMINIYNNFRTEKSLIVSNTTQVNKISINSIYKSEENILSDLHIIKKDMIPLNNDNISSYNAFFTFTIFSIFITILCMVIALYTLVFKEKKE